MKKIRKAIFPVAGLGTRFLPATKAMPKEMLPVVDRPLIQHVVDEAREAGIEHFIFVTGRNKHIIEDHFDRQIELENTLLRAPEEGCRRVFVTRIAASRARPASPASRSRSVSATPYGVHGNWSGPNLLRCFCQMCSYSTRPAAWRK